MLLEVYVTRNLNITFRIYSVSEYKYNTNSSSRANIGLNVNSEEKKLLKKSLCPKVKYTFQLYLLHEILFIMWLLC